MKHTRVMLAAVLPAIFAGIVWAQAPAGMGGLSGTVRDAQSAVVPGAQITIINAEKGIRRTTETNDTGIFAAPALLPASGYHVTVTKSGFATFEARNVEILVGQQLDLSVVLQI